MQTVLINVTTSETNNGVILGNYELRVSSLPSNDPNAGHVTLLDQLSLTTVVDVAMDLWNQAGVPSEAIVALKNNLEFRIMDLPGTYLGHVSGNVIWIDANAAGYGWFVDLTPWDGNGFDLASSNK